MKPNEAIETTTWRYGSRRCHGVGYLYFIFGNLDAHREKVRVFDLTQKFPFFLFVYLFHILEISSSVAFLTVAMRLFKRRVSDPAPQLVSLAAINSEMEQPAGSTRVPPAPNTQRYSGNNSEDYADYQTVTAMPAMVVVDDAPRKGEFPSQLPSHDLF